MFQSKMFQSENYFVRKISSQKFSSQTFSSPTFSSQKISSQKFSSQKISSQKFSSQTFSSQKFSSPTFSRQKFSSQKIFLSKILDMKNQYIFVFFQFGLKIILNFTKFSQLLQVIDNIKPAEAVSYFRWAAGEPTNWGGHDENSVEFFGVDTTWATGYWNDIHRWENRQFICQKPAEKYKIFRQKGIRLRMLANQRFQGNITEITQFLGTTSIRFSVKISGKFYHEFLPYFLTTKNRYF